MFILILDLPSKFLRLHLMEKLSFLTTCKGFFQQLMFLTHLADSANNPDDLNLWLQHEIHYLHHTYN